MAIALSTEAEPWVSKEDLEGLEENRTTFMLANLKSKDWNRLIAKIGSKDGTITLLGEGAAFVLELTLKGWENLKNAQGEEVGFDHGRMERNLDRMPAGLRMEAALHVLGKNKLTEDDVKN